jgi:hypothetical protein
MPGTRSLIIVGALALLLAACGGDSNSSDKHTPVPTATTPPTLSPALANLRRDYQALSAAQQAIGTVWENLATGQQAQCGTYPDVLSPDSISAEGDSTYEPLAQLLRRAAIATDQAVTLWRAECDKERQNPPPDVIDQGRLAARAAGDALREAGTLLAAIP